MTAELLNAALHRKTIAQYERMRASGNSFVHYSSAEAAFAIITSRKVRMRKSNLMNDFSELEHGLDCLQAVFKNELGASFNKKLDAIYPGVSQEILDLFNGWLPDMRENTYIACFAEHDGGDEDQLGRLSMWRAYGGSTGVAIVLNPKVFLEPTDALNSWTFPVTYQSPDDFARDFIEIDGALTNYSHIVKAVGRDAVVAGMFDFLKRVMLCTKHPGFKEEREWRVIHSPTPDPTDRLERKKVVIKGVPQVVYEIPLEDIPDEGLIGAALPGLVRRVIIGPSYDSAAIAETMAEILNEAGVPDAKSKVTRSSIPLRNW